MRRLLLVALVSLALGCARPPLVRLATTTSVENSGLLSALLPAFTATTGLEVQAIAVGSGRALDILDRGDVDLALTHDPDAEHRLFDRHALAEYRKVMFNDFVIAGPAGDAAGVRHATTSVDAMTRIASSNASFASRADSSGTHTRELSLWKAAGRAPAPRSLIETGQGMAATLRIASERQAYVLTDRSTLRQLESTLRLVIVYEGDPPLLNTYAVMYKTSLAGNRLDRAKQFVAWLADGAGRDAIARYQIKGQPAFTIWPAGGPRSHPDDLPHAR